MISCVEYLWLSICVECAFPLWCASVFIDGPLAFKRVESFGVLARSSRRLNRRVE